MSMDNDKNEKRRGYLRESLCDLLNEVFNLIAARRRMKGKGQECLVCVCVCVYIRGTITKKEFISDEV